MMLLHAILMFRLLPHEFTNHEVRDLVTGLAGRAFTAGQLTYDLRPAPPPRPRPDRPDPVQPPLPGHRHRIGASTVPTRAHDRLLRTGLADITGPDNPRPLRTATRADERALHTLMEESRLAA